MNIELKPRDYMMLIDVLDEALDHVNEELANARSLYNPQYKPHRIAYIERLVEKAKYVRNLAETWGEKSGNDDQAEAQAA